MAEVKNAFIKSKMNKDLDDRLVPPGEYRNGLNVQVSKSEGEDVGALENVIGNIVVTTGSGPSDGLDNVDFSVLSGLNTGTLKSIGLLADTNSSKIFVFLTDYTEPAAAAINPEYNIAANNFIYSYNTLTSDTIKLAEGAFLNFSTTYPIYGINILEDVLLWTDNRNQPRKLNISVAEDDGGYYNSEDLISVAKYNPYQAINLYYVDTFANTPIGDNNPNFNRNVSAIQDVVSEFLPDGTTKNMYYDPTWPGDPDYLEDKFVSFSYRFKFNDGEYSITAPFTQEAFIPKQDGYFLAGDEDNAYRSSLVRFMENKANNVKLQIPLPASADSVSRKFDISSIDILYKESDALSIKVLDTVIESQFRSNSNGLPNSTDVFVYNYQSRKPYKTLPESEIIRVYDKTPVKALGQEVISNRVVYSNFQDKHTPPNHIDYDVAVTPKYAFSQPEDKSLWSTSIIEYPEHSVKENRNYQVGFVLSDRYGRQSSTILSNVTDKNKFDQLTNTFFGGSTFYHPYQADPDLLDPQGVNETNNRPGDSIKVLINERVSGSEKRNLRTLEPGFYEPYYLPDGITLNPDYNPLGWYSYKIVVKQTEQEYYNVYLPGILNGYPDYASGATDLPDPVNSIAYITLLNGNINKVPRELITTTQDQTQYGSSVMLYGRVTPAPLVLTPTSTETNLPYYPQVNDQTVVAIAEQDNMFKDASTAGPFGTVYQTDSDPYVARLLQGTVSINSGADKLPLPIGSLQVTQAAQLENPYPHNLGIFETNPVESRLDIFWETSTTGLISELNNIAGESSFVNGFQDFDWQQSEAYPQGSNATFPLLNNNTSPGFVPTSLIGTNITPIDNTRVELISIYDAFSPNPITSRWRIERLYEADGVTLLVPNRYNLVVNTASYFNPDSTQNVFDFKFNVVTIDTQTPDPLTQSGFAETSQEIDFSKTLLNKDPEITTDTTLPILAPNERNFQVDPLITFAGLNGAVLPLNQTANLSWSISNESSSPPLELIGSSVYEKTGSARGNYSFDVTLTDSGGANDSVTKTVKIIFGQEQINSSFGSASNKIVSNGLQSSGVYWSNDYSNCITSGPIPAMMDNNEAGIIGRAAYKADTLNNTLDPNALITATNQVVSVENIYDLDPQGPQQYRWYNGNYRPDFFDNEAADQNNSHALSSGTAYVKLDFEFEPWGAEDSIAYYNANIGEPRGPDPEQQIGVVWLAYLQYRVDSSSNWQQARDIEGSNIIFNNINQNSVLTRNSPDFFAKGIQYSNPTSPSYPLNNDYENQVRSTSTAYPGENTRSNDNTNLQNPIARRNNSPTSISSKIFAFGKAQTYSGNDRLGEYRLLIRYPQSSVRNDRFRPLPTTTREANWVWQIRGATKIGGVSSSRVKVKLDFGDFYYPKTTTETAFSYRVSLEGSSDSIISSGTTPTIEVWAREWSFKYVTTFYTGADLQTVSPVLKKSHGGNNWFCYSGFNDGSENTDNGTENSSPRAIGETLELSDFPSDSVNDSNRRWVAQFDDNGLKIAGTSTPSGGDLRIN